MEVIVIHGSDKDRKLEELVARLQETKGNCLLLVPSLFWFDIIIDDHGRNGRFNNQTFNLAKVLFRQPRICKTDNGSITLKTIRTIRTISRSRPKYDNVFVWCAENRKFEGLIRDFCGECESIVLATCVDTIDYSWMESLNPQQWTLINHEEPKHSHIIARYVENGIDKHLYKYDE